LGVQVDPAFEGPGVRIAQVIPGGSAEKAGVKDGDILIAVDSVAIESSEQLIALISGKQIGARVKLKIKRDLDDLELDAELQARGNR
jgi:putative serine protease PepD